MSPFVAALVAVAFLAVVFVITGGIGRTAREAETVRAARELKRLASPPEAARSAGGDHLLRPARR